MCGPGCINFGSTNLFLHEIQNKRVIEIGSYNILLNGSLRDHIQSLNPSEYIGVDIETGKGVDIICPAENVLDKFGKESFDVVISTELLEHVLDWRKVISNMKNLCKPNGIILITTRSIGFIFHTFPCDYWRYEISDIVSIFGDCIIKNIALDDTDNNGPGVLVKIKKPDNFKEKDLSDYRLYFMAAGKRILNISMEY